MRVGKLEIGPGGIILILLIISGLVVVGLKQMGVDLIGMIKGKKEATTVTNTTNNSGNTANNTTNATTIRIKGSSAIGDKLGKDWAQEFMNSNAGKIVLIETKGTSTGFQALIGGEADIAAASRPANEKEEQAAQAAGFSLVSADSEHTVAFDAIAIAVHPNNPVEKLTITQAKDIFTGKVTDWSKVGGKSGAIKVILRPKELGAYELFQELVLGKGTPFLTGAEELKENAKVSEQLRADVNAISFISLAGLGGAKALKLAASETTTAIEPSEVTIRNKSYLLNRNLYLYTKGAPQGLVKDFIDYVLGPGQELTANYYVNLKLKLVADTSSGAASANPKRKKFNTDIRFQTSSTQVNNLAVYDLNQISADICPRASNISIELIGYSDSQGDPKQNLELSKQRAESVAQVLKGKCPSITIESKGLGSASPIGDNSTEEGKLLNRRVEIWVIEK
ncbi:MAG: substrate-binding domain-containing protein [Blastocatellia bacterium]|nr:substrate-binding domain-containing protein [Blastocatellia bacterium]